MFPKWDQSHNLEKPVLTAASVGIGRGDSEGMAHACAGLTWGVCGVVATCAILSLFALLYCVCCFIICSKSRWCRNRDKRTLARRRPCRTVRHLLVSNMLYRCYGSFTMIYTKVALSDNIIVNSQPVGNMCMEHTKQILHRLVKSYIRNSKV